MAYSGPARACCWSATTNVWYWVRIASNDVLGEKPVQLGPQRGVKRQEIRVRDIMIPSERLDVLHYADFVHAGVAHTFAEIGAALTR